MYSYKEFEMELRKVITPETVFVCIGSSRVKFDIFGPLCGTYLKRNGVPCYGDMRDPVNALTMHKKLHLIYDVDQHDNKNIIGIDACLDVKGNKLNEVRFDSLSGVKPAAGVGGKFPMVGNTSIIMYTITLEDVRRVYNGFEDVSNRQLIKRQAKIVTDIITKVYNEICNCEEANC